MISLCDAIDAEATKLFGKELMADWRFVAVDRNTCEVHTSRFIITFSVDSRDKQISSSIAFKNVAGRAHEALQSHIIAKLFTNLEWNQVRDLDVPKAVALEVGNVKELLQAIDNANLSGRDLLYFYLGYNAAYTDYMNSG